MTLDDAREIIRDRSSSFPRQVEAAALIAGSKRSELNDLIRCLHLRGLPAETAATALYMRTGRPYSGDVTDFSVEPGDWSRYLARQLDVVQPGQEAD